MNLLLLAEETLTPWGQFGIAGAVLAAVAGFLAYLKHESGENRRERAETQKLHKETVEGIVSKCESGHALARQHFHEMLREKFGQQV